MAHKTRPTEPDTTRHPDAATRLLAPAQSSAVPLLVAGRTDAETAAELGVHRRTVSQWKNHHPASIAELNRTRDTVNAELSDRLRVLASAALRAIGDALVTHSVAVLREQGLVDPNRAAQDGTRVRASAGAASFRRKPTPGECPIEAAGRVARLKAELDDGPSAGSRRRAAARERAARERVERVQAAWRRLPESEAEKRPDEREEARCSTTDAEATVMEMADGGFRPAYNVQFAADAKSQVIVGVDALATGSDQGQMTPVVEQIRTRHGRCPAEYPADGGFARHADPEAVSERGVTVSAPVPTPKDACRDRHQRPATDSLVIGGWRERMGTAAAKGSVRGAGGDGGRRERPGAEPGVAAGPGSGGGECEGGGVVVRGGARRGVRGAPPGRSARASKPWTAGTCPRPRST